MSLVIMKGYLLMDSKVAKLIEKLRMKFPEQLKKEPLLDQLEMSIDSEEEVEGEEVPMDEEIAPPVNIDEVAMEDEEEEDDYLA